jgi:hypothetical protein
MSIVPESIDRYMRSPEERLDRMLSDFERAHDTATSTPGRNLRTLLEESPELERRFVDAVKHDQLRTFEPLPANVNAAATYSSDTGAIRLPLDALARTYASDANTLSMLSVLGHEIEHARFSDEKNAVIGAFEQRIFDIARSPGPHDYTDAIRPVLAVQRENEARAEIGGFNAYAARVMADHPGAGLKELYEAHPLLAQAYIDRTGKSPSFGYAMKPGLTLDADNTIAASPENIEAMSRLYFDLPPTVTRLGPNANQDYTNYYGDFALSKIERAERAALVYAKTFDPSAVAPEVVVDMNALGLRSALLQTSLSISAPDAPEAAIAKPGIGPIAPPQGEAPIADAAGEHPMYGQALRAIDGLAAQLGLNGRGEAANLAAATAAQAMQAGMDRVDGVLVGVSGRLYAYQGDPASASVHRAAVDVDQAKLTPARDSLDALATATPRCEPQPPSQSFGMRL